MNAKRAAFGAEGKAETIVAQQGHPLYVHKRLPTPRLKAVDSLRGDEIAAIAGIHKTSVGCQRAD